MNDKNFQTIRTILCTAHWITDRISKELKAFAITEAQYNVLRILGETRGKPITVQEILAKMVQRSSNVTRIIDKLLSKEYVERKECPANRRKMDISITKKGEKLLDKLDQKVQAIYGTILDRLTEKEIDLLNKIILKLKEDYNE